MKPVEPVQMNTYQINSAGYILMMSQGFKKQKLKDQQSYISIIVVYLAIPSSSKEVGISPDMTTVFHTWL